MLQRSDSILFEVTTENLPRDTVGLSGPWTIISIATISRIFQEQKRSIAIGLLTSGIFALTAIFIIRSKMYGTRDQKSTRLNSSHVSISYAVFCLEKIQYDAVMYYRCV